MLCLQNTSIHRLLYLYIYIYDMFCSINCNPCRLTRDLSFNIYYIPIGYHNHCYFILLQQYSVVYNIIIIIIIYLYNITNQTCSSFPFSSFCSYHRTIRRRYCTGMDVASTAYVAVRELEDPNNG